MLSLRQPARTETAPFTTSANHHLTRFLNPDILRTLAIPELGNIGEPVTNGPDLLEDRSEVVLDEAVGDRRLRHEDIDESDSSVRLSTVVLSAASEASTASHDSV